MTDSVKAPHGAVIFCRVIDNFGDAGVTWRLAKRLRDLGFPTALIIDSLETLGKLVHDLDPTKPVSTVRGITVADWDTFEAEAKAGDLSAISGAWPDLVLETFGCRLPEVVEQGLCDGKKRLYMNLDYLSAEEWVEGSHMIWGLHPTLPIKKLWFFPGFTDKTGGVLIEDGLEEARLAFDRGAFLAKAGALPGRRTLYFFAYPVNAVDQLAAGLLAADEPLNLILAPGAASDMLEERLAARLAGSDRIHLVRAPFVPQEDFDNWLRAADGVIIRGEDSFVRAQLAAVPLLWATYPTEDKAHEIKLDAWLDRFESVFRPEEEAARIAFDAAAKHWVRGTLTPEDFTGWLASLPVQRLAAARWQQSLLARGDLARHIALLVPNNESDLFLPADKHPS